MEFFSFIAAAALLFVLLIWVVFIAVCVMGPTRIAMAIVDRLFERLENIWSRYRNGR